MGKWVILGGVEHHLRAAKHAPSLPNGMAVVADSALVHKAQEGGNGDAGEGGGETMQMPYWYLDWNLAGAPSVN